MFLNVLLSMYSLPSTFNAYGESGSPSATAMQIISVISFYTFVYKEVARTSAKNCRKSIDISLRALTFAEVLANETILLNCRHAPDAHALQGNELLQLWHIPHPKRLIRANASARAVFVTELNDIIAAERFSVTMKSGQAFHVLCKQVGTSLALAPALRVAYLSSCTATTASGADIFAAGAIVFVHPGMLGRVKLVCPIPGDQCSIRNVQIRHASRHF